MSDDVKTKIQDVRLQLAACVNEAVKTHGPHVSFAALQLVAGEFVAKAAALPQNCPATVLLGFLDGFRLAFDAIFEVASKENQPPDHEHDRSLN